MIKYRLDTEIEYTNKSGHKFKVIEFVNALKVKVEFKSGYIEWFHAANIRKGSITDKLSPSVHGVGINDSGYDVNPIINGKRVLCPIYQKWSSMIARCYSEAGNKPTYKNVTVCDEWLLFSNFKKWIETQDYIGKDLDKDVVNPSNKVYSPDNCVLISHHVNSLLLDCGAARGKLPIGVTKNWNKYEAKCSINAKKSVYLGLHDTPEKAHAAYVDYKSQLLRDEAEKHPKKIRNGLIRHAAILEESKKV